MLDPGGVSPREKLQLPCWSQVPPQLDRYMLRKNNAVVISNNNHLADDSRRRSFKNTFRCRFRDTFIWRTSLTYNEQISCGSLYPSQFFKSQLPTLLERATARTASANHTQERPSTDYIIVEAYMVLIGGNRDSFHYRASRNEYALACSLCLEPIQITHLISQFGQLRIVNRIGSSQWLVERFEKY